MPQFYLFLFAQDFSKPQTDYIGYCYILVLFVYIFVFYITREQKHDDIKKNDNNMYH